MVIMIRELVVERYDAVARLPVDAAQQLRKRGGCVRNKGDVGRVAMHEARAELANAVAFVEPVHEIGAGQAVAAFVMLRRGFHRATRDLAEGRGIEKSPLGERGKFRAHGLPIGAHGVAINCFTPAAASATATSCDFLPCRWTSSTSPPASFFPTTTRNGMPTRSASLNLTPGRSSRSSSRASRPMARQAR